MEEAEAPQAVPAEVAAEEEVHPPEEEAPAVDHPVEPLPEDHLVEPLPEDHPVAPARGTPVPVRETLEALEVQTLDIHQLKAIKDQRIMDTPRIPQHTQTLTDTAPAQEKV